MCVGTQCNACVIARRLGGTPLDHCDHGHVERHLTVTPLEPLGIDEAIAELELDATVRGGGPVFPRSDTRPLRVTETIEIDLSDNESAACFLELAAKIVRARNKITITIG